MLQHKILSLGLIFSSVVVLSGCQETSSHQNKENKEITSTQAEQQKLVVGFQKSSLSLLIARQEKLLEKNIPNTKIEWKEFPAGPQLLEALSVGGVDIGFVGNIPPIFAQSGGKDISYVAYEVVPATSIAVLVQADSLITTIEQLKGKRIALQKGSSAHELLAKILQKANLTWGDITPIWLPPADARAAFDKKAVDAWVAWDPFLSVAERDVNAKTIFDGSHFPATYQYYIANPNYSTKHPEVIAKFIASTNQANQWMTQYPEQTIQYYAEAIKQDKQISKKALDKINKNQVIKPLDATIVQSQQKIADLFYSVKLIPKPIDVKQVVPQL